MSDSPETPGTSEIDAVPTPTTSRRIPISPLVNLIGGVMVISGFLLPWFRLAPGCFALCWQAKQIFIVVNGVADAMAPFQKGDHVTGEAFSAFIIVILPLVFALVSLASGIIALRRPVPLALHSLSLASAISGLFISSTFFSTAFSSTTLFSSPFPNFPFVYYANDRGLGIPLIFAGFLVLVVGNILGGRMDLKFQQEGNARSKFTGVVPGIFSFVGGIFLIAGFFLPLYFQVPMPLSEDSVTVPTNTGFVMVPAYNNHCGTSPGSLSAVSDWSQISDLVYSRNTRSQDRSNSIFTTGSIIALLFPLIIGVLVSIIGILLIVKGPRLILVGLYVPAVVLTINGYLGYAIYQIYVMYESIFFPFEYSWGTVAITIGDPALLAGGVALALVHLRALRPQQPAVSPASD